MFHKNIAGQYRRPLALFTTANQRFSDLTNTLNWLQMSQKRPTPEVFSTEVFFSSEIILNS